MAWSYFFKACSISKKDWRTKRIACPAASKIQNASNFVKFKKFPKKFNNFLNSPPTPLLQSPKLFWRITGDSKAKINQCSLAVLIHCGQLDNFPNAIEYQTVTSLTPSNEQGVICTKPQTWSYIYPTMMKRSASSLATRLQHNATDHCCFQEWNMDMQSVKKESKNTNNEKKNNEKENKV